MKTGDKIGLGSLIVAVLTLMIGSNIREQIWTPRAAQSVPEPDRQSVVTNGNPEPCAGGLKFDRRRVTSGDETSKLFIDDASQFVIEAIRAEHCEDLVGGRPLDITVTNVDADLLTEGPHTWSGHATVLATARATASSHAVSLVASADGLGERKNVAELDALRKATFEAIEKLKRPAEPQ